MCSTILTKSVVTPKGKGEDKYSDLTNSISRPCIHAHTAQLLGNDLTLTFSRRSLYSVIRPT